MLGQAADQHSDDVELTILMPCLNEAETIEVCVRKAAGYLARAGIRGEVLIADNGSTDGSQAMARALGARVVDVPVRGYGAALIAGIKAAHGRYVIMGDADDSYDFTALDVFVERLRAGYQLVMGNRFKGGIMPGAMPPLHRYLGNPVLSAAGRIFTSAPIKDFHCGLRGFSREAILGLNLKTTGMEFASEMVVLASYNRLRIAEVPTTLSPDGRSRPPHLRSWRDGWRHLRFLLAFAPSWLFLYPGILLVALGLIGTVLLMGSDVSIGSVGLGIHTLLFATAATLIGTQLMSFWYIGQMSGVSKGFWPSSPALERCQGLFEVNRSALLGGIMIVGGLALALTAFAGWAQGSFGPLDGNTGTTRMVISSVLLCALGVQLLMTGFLGSLLGDRG